MAHERFGLQVLPGVSMAAVTGLIGGVKGLVLRDNGTCHDGLCSSLLHLVLISPCPPGPDDHIGSLGF